MIAAAVLTLSRFAVADVHNRGAGCLPDTPDPRDANFCASSLVSMTRGAHRPRSMNWFGLVNIHDQLKWNSCVGHVLAGAVPLRARIEGYEHIEDGSGEGVYTLTRMSVAGRNAPIADHGTSPRHAFECARTFGIVPAKMWPPPDVDHSDVGSWINRRMDNDWAALAAGADHRLERYWWVDVALSKRAELICELVAAGYPVCLAVANDSKLQACNDERPLAAPDDVELADGRVGLHYMYIAGYDADDNPIAVNSWGTSHGHGGLVTLSKERIAHPTTQSIAAVGVDVF